MCTSLLNLASTFSTAQSDAAATPRMDARDALAAQAGAQGAASLAALASGVTRSRAMKLDAMSAEQVGEARARRIRVAGERELAKSRADVVGTGTRVGVGSALEAERAVTRGYEQDAEVAVVNGRNDARSIGLEAGRVRDAAVGESLAHGMAAADKWRRSRKYAEQPMPWTDLGF